MFTKTIMTLTVAVLLAAPSAVYAQQENTSPENRDMYNRSNAHHEKVTSTGAVTVIPKVTGRVNDFRLMQQRSYEARGVGYPEKSGAFTAFAQSLNGVTPDTVITNNGIIGHDPDPNIRLQMLRSYSARGF